MLKQLFIFLKGMLFGFANVIPGVSGGTMAVITKVYDKLLGSINNLFKKFKPSILFLLVYGLGAVVAVIFGSKVLVLATNKIPFPIAMLFAGLIIGTIPFLAKPIIHEIKWQYVIVFILAMAVVIGMLFIGLKVSNNKTELQPVDYFLLFVCGFLASVAMVTPGISGMMMFQIFGYYQLLMNAISHLFSNFGQNVLILLPIALGVIAGIFTACKIMSIILKKFPKGTMFAILGFVIASIFCLFYNAEFKVTEANFDGLQISLAIVFLIMGALGSYFLSQIGEKQENAVVENAENLSNNNAEIALETEPNVETDDKSEKLNENEVKK